MPKQTIPVITLDGPSGTGKGTLCYLLAEHLQWHMLDSGAIYRVLAYAARQAGVDWAETEKLTSLALALDLQFKAETPSTRQVLLNQKDIYLAIRTEQCGQDASKIAVLPEVRAALLQRQRDFAKAPGLVTDGRDMGTVVFPEAQLKIFLSATVEERARRRFLQLKEQGIDVSLHEVVEELMIRDARDTARAIAPLKPAADALLVDTTGLSIVQVFNNVLELVHARWPV
jgi:cytidylate kinase